MEKGWKSSGRKKCGTRVGKKVEKVWKGMVKGVEKVEIVRKKGVKKCAKGVERCAKGVEKRGMGWKSEEWGGKGVKREEVEKG